MGARVGEAAANVLVRETGIVARDVWLVPAEREKLEDEVDREPGSAQDWLAAEHVAMDRDVFLPGHPVLASVLLE